MNPILLRRAAPVFGGLSSTGRCARRGRAMLAGVALAAALALAPGLLPGTTGKARAEDSVYTLTLKDHKFTPDTIEVPAGRRVKLVIRNEDATPEEFDSSQLHREKVVPGGAEGVVYIGPLKPGTYSFIGEYHEATAKGRVVAK